METVSPAILEKSLADGYTGAPFADPGTIIACLTSGPEGKEIPFGYP
jgi:hypothetical protein